MKTSITVTLGQVARCPSNRFDVRHYNPDGTCKCKKTKKRSTRAAKR